MSLTLNNSNDISCDSLYLIYNNNLENILYVVSGSASGSGTVTSANAPLNITTSGVLSLDLTNIMATTHEANKIGTADVNFGLHYISSSDITIYDHSGNGAHTVLSTGASGDLYVTDGLKTIRQAL